MSTSVRIFVYGTLRRLPGNPMHGLLGEARFLGRATCRGLLYSAGSYPALVRSDDPNDQVTGEIYEVLDPEEVLPALDEYEGCDPANNANSLFRRETAVFQLETGTFVEAWTYLYNRPVATLDPIPGGNYAMWPGRR